MTEEQIDHVMRLSEQLREAVAEATRLRAALDARDAALRAAAAKGHRQGCSAKERYLHGECTCSWMLEHAATIEAALAAAKEGK